MNILNTFTSGWNRFWNAGNQIYEAAKSSSYYADTEDYNFDHDQMLDLANLETLRSCGREIYSNFSPVAGAVHDKSTTAVGQHWIPIYYGSDERWGREATAWLKEYFKVSDVRGFPHTFVNNQWVGSTTLDRDGEYFTIPILNANGFPQFQFLEGHRVGSRYGADEHVERFPGSIFVNGVWKSMAGRPIAYNVLGKTPELDRVILAKNMWHTYDPKWYSQSRGIPSLVQGLLDWKDAKKFRDNEKTASNIFSSLTIVQKNAQGKPDPTKDYFDGKSDGVKSDGVTEKSLVIEEFLRGAVRYIRANGKDEIQSFDYNRPPDQTQKFIHGIMRGAFSGMDWPIEQAYDMGGIGTAQVRAITNKCQRAVGRRQETLCYPAFKQLQFALAAASNSGLIRKAPLDWWKWGFAMPPKMTNDAYREAAQDREDYKIGFLTLREVYARRGEWWIDHLDQRFIEESYIDQKVLESGIQMERVRMLTPNGNPVQSSEEEEKNSQDEKDKEQDDKDSKKE